MIRADPLTIGKGARLRLGPEEDAPALELLISYRRPVALRVAGLGSILRESTRRSKTTELHHEDFAGEDFVLKVPPEAFERIYLYHFARYFSQPKEEHG